jgi:hypothetical protein
MTCESVARVRIQPPSLRAQAKQSILPRKESWIASSLSLLAMTAEHTFAFSRRVASELCQEFFALSKQRARGMPGARRTRSLVCAWGSEYAHECSQRGRQNHPASPRNGLRLMARSPRRSGCLASVASGFNSTGLTPASRRQDHTSSPSASVPFVIGTSTSTASRPAFVTIASRPFGWDETVIDMPVIWGDAEPKYFLLWDSTAQITQNLARRADQSAESAT